MYINKENKTLLNHSVAYAGIKKTGGHAQK